MSIITIQPGEIGYDFSYGQPDPQLIVDLGATFVFGYVLGSLGKDLIHPERYLDKGTAVGYVAEVNQTRSSGGRSVGVIDGAAAAKQCTGLGYPEQCTVVAANDTGTTVANRPTQIAYMDGFHSQRDPYGIYAGTKLGEVVPGWSIGCMPSAWSWSVDIGPHLLGESNAEYWQRGFNAAIKRATALGYHLIQHPSEALVSGVRVDKLVCIKAFRLWSTKSQPSPQKGEPVTPYVFQLADGGLGIRHESGSRSINQGELEGPLAGEVVHQIPKGSNWEGWVLKELGKYQRDLDPLVSTGQSQQSQPLTHLSLDIKGVPGTATGTLSP